MEKYFIHISDLHFREHWEENQEVVLNAFFEDLAKRIENIDRDKIYFIFSGDIVHSGGNANLYNLFLKEFSSKLDNLKILKSHRISIPGNHDVSKEYIESKFEEHEGVVNLGLDETKFNNYIKKENNIFKSKFDNYQKFEETFADIGINNNLLSGVGWNIDGNIGVYCLNTAVCSSGGYNKINDEKRLAIDTRSLHKWVSECPCKVKILVMHHPKNWLIDWAEKEIHSLLKKSFSLCLSGHIHDQSTFHSINDDSSLVECSAPPLLTNKDGKLGYCIIAADSEGIIDLQYRQWTKGRKFVTGVDFSDTDDGRIKIKRAEKINEKKSTNEVFTHFLNKRLDDALSAFSGQPKVWIDPLLNKKDEISQNADDTYEKRIDINEIIQTPKSIIIRAPPQFGLTCLCHYMIKKAWISYSKVWLYLESDTLKANNIEKSIRKELDNLNIKMSDVECIILDSWNITDKDSVKILVACMKTYH